MTDATSSISNQKRNHGVHRCRRRISSGERTITSLSSLQLCSFYLLLLALAQNSPVLHVEGWGQLIFIPRCGTRQTTMAPRKISSQNQPRLALRATSSGDFSFFEDPSTTMEKGGNATAIVNENEQLRHSIRQLEEENGRLKDFVEQQHQKELEAAAVTMKAATGKQLVLETFEGEGLFASDSSSYDYSDELQVGDESDELWCDSLDGDECPLEPSLSFGEALRDRACWLVGLLIMQSLSGIILSRNELLLTNHPVIIYYLTMMVGAGGNAGNQASVRVIRGIALGTLNERTQSQFLLREFKMAGSLSVILSLAGFVRTIVFRTPLPEAISVTTALSLIVFSSVCLGAILPLGLERIGVDPAHSSTTIQVIMDILGVLLAVLVSTAILDGPLGVFIFSKLAF